MVHSSPFHGLLLTSEQAIRRQRPPVWKCMASLQWSEWRAVKKPSTTRIHSFAQTAKQVSKHKQERNSSEIEINSTIFLSIFNRILCLYTFTRVNNEVFCVACTVYYFELPIHCILLGTWIKVKAHYTPCILGSCRLCQITISFWAMLHSTSSQFKMTLQHSKSWWSLLFEVAFEFRICVED